jgi:hypothetical protein
MKARKRKLIAQKQIRYNNAWDWRYGKLMDTIVTVSRRISDKMAEVYAKVRQERMEA